jgi:hypothetical protein
VIELLLLLGLHAPPEDSLLEEGRRLAAMHPTQAALVFERVLAADSLQVEANWRAAIAISDRAELLPAGSFPLQDSLGKAAERYARRAVRLAPDAADPLFALGLVLGRASLHRGIRERVRVGEEVRALAERAIAADSLHDGAHHLLGRWHYEVKLLSGFERFVARAFLGGKTLGQARWDTAEAELRTAVALDTTRIYHRLDLARVYLARGKPGLARIELERILVLPDRVAADASWRAEARGLLDKLGNR